MRHVVLYAKLHANYDSMHSITLDILYGNVNICCHYNVKMQNSIQRCKRDGVSVV